MSTQRKTQAQGAWAPLTFRLTDAEREALRVIAERNHRSMTGQLRAWIAADSEPERGAA